MIDIDQLAPGKIVRLVSGSPKMVVTGFVTAINPKREAIRTAVKLLLWDDAQGFVRIDLAPELLTFPRVREPSPPPSDDAED